MTLHTGAPKVLLHYVFDSSVYDSDRGAVQWGQKSSFSSWKLSDRERLRGAIRDSSHFLSLVLFSANARCIVLSTPPEFFSWLGEAVHGELSCPSRPRWEERDCKFSRWQEGGWRSWPCAPSSNSVSLDTIASESDTGQKYLVFRKAADESIQN